MKQAGNELEVVVVNSWFNRLVKDAVLPESERLTRTNIRVKPGSQPQASGLFGPVTLWRERS